MLKISIITVNFNNYEGLLKTFESVAQVKTPFVEYIVIDGGSKDGSVELIRKFRHQIDILVVESDEGVYDAMNKGIARASGMSIIFMNSGDIFNESFAFDDIFRDKYFYEKVFYSDSILDIDGVRVFNPVKDQSRSWWRYDPPCHQCILIPTLFLKSNMFDQSYKIYADAVVMKNAFEVYRSQKLDRPIAIFEVGGLSSTFKSLSEYLGAYREKCRFLEVSPTILGYLKWILHYYLKRIIGIKFYRLLFER